MLYNGEEVGSGEGPEVGRSECVPVRIEDVQRADFAAHRYSLPIGRNGRVAKDVVAGEILALDIAGRVVWPGRWTRLARHGFECAPRRPQTLNRLRASVFRIDEVAFEMRRQHACRARVRRFTRLAHLIEHCPQGPRRARQRRRTECRDTVARKARSDRANGSGAAERIDSVDAVHVDVDQPRHDVVIVKRKRRRLSASAWRVGANLDDLGLGVLGVGDHAGLTAGERVGGHAEVVQRHAQQGHGLALPSGDQHVHLSTRAAPRHLVGQVQQVVGLGPHGADDNDHLVSLAVAAGHVVGHRADPLGVGDGRAAEFLDDQAAVDGGHDTRGYQRAFGSQPMVFCRRVPSRAGLGAVSEATRCPTTVSARAD